MTSWFSDPPANPLQAFGVSELETYVATINHTHPSGELAWSIRVGTAGQLYSIQDNAQHEYIGSSPQSPTTQWQDRVFQFLFGSYSTSALADDGTHLNWATQAGSYSQVLYTSEGVEGSYPPAFSPLVRDWWDETTSTYHMLSLPCQPATGDWSVLPDSRAWQVSALQQTSIRSLGSLSASVSGFEVLTVITNFGPQLIDNMGLWSGFDPTHLTYRWDASDHGEETYTYAGDAPPRWDESAASFYSYGGWSAYTNTSEGTGSTFGVAMALNRSLPQAKPFGLYMGSNDDTSSILSLVLQSFDEADTPYYYVYPGQTYYSRVYVLFSTNGVDDLSGVANSIVNTNVQVGNLTLTLARAQAYQNCSLLDEHGLSPACIFWALDSPAFYPLPILLIQNAASSLFSITTDPYLYPAVQSPELVSPSLKHVSKLRGMLGWGIKLTPETLMPPCPGLVLLSSLLAYPLYNDPIDLGVDVWVGAQPFDCSQSQSSSNETTPPTYTSSTPVQRSGTRFAPDSSRRRVLAVHSRSTAQHVGGGRGDRAGCFHPANQPPNCGRDHLLDRQAGQWRTAVCGAR